MARPRRPSVERALLLAAASELGCSGSSREQARQIAAAVAGVAVAVVISADDDSGLPVTLAAMRLVSPSVVELATDPSVDVAQLVQRESIRAFEAAGYRAVPCRSALVQAVSAWLSGRYRRALK